MLSPFVSRQEGKPSYGLGSFGYDLRLGRRILVPLGGVDVVLDPVQFPKGHFRTLDAEGTIDLPPNSQVLAESVERFQMPDDVCGVCWGKSSYARCGLLVNV
ncbi:MAG: dCTP deaminase, partial [Candidatus Bipolaricaulota bacterium]|nr:dCTP deaminase [Candidatus Bipolaricaulota bacterium]